MRCERCGHSGCADGVERHRFLGAVPDNQRWDGTTGQLFTGNGGNAQQWNFPV